VLFWRDVIVRHVASPFKILLARERLKMFWCSFA